MRCVSSLLLAGAILSLTILLGSGAGSDRYVSSSPAAPTSQHVQARCWDAAGPGPCSKITESRPRTPLTVSVARSKPTADSSPEQPKLSSLAVPAPWRRTQTPSSPLYPQNEVTLWDRIRVSSPRDRRAFLQGIAIQIHTPQIAATPGRPRANLEPSESSPVPH